MGDPKNPPVEDLKKYTEGTSVSNNSPLHSKGKVKLKSYHGMFKDIEIERKDYVFLDFVFDSILYSIALIIALVFDLDLYAGGEGGAIFFLLAGVLLGGILSAFLTNRIKRRVKAIKYLLITSSIIFFVQITFLRGFPGIINNICFLIGGVIIELLFFLFLILFLESTSILERGRVMSYVLMGTILSAVIIVMVVALGVMFFPPLLYIPVLFNIVPLYLMFKDPTYEKPLLKEKRQGQQHLNKDLTISVLIIAVFGINLILSIPVDEIMEWSSQNWWDESFLVPVGITVLFSVLLTLLIGVIFDFIGRVATFTILIVAIAIFNFLSIFEFQIPFVRASLVVSAFIAAFMSIPLLVGDLAKRINYGKILPFTFIIFSAGMGIGILIYSFIEIRRPDPAEAQAILTGAQSLSAIFCLVLLLIGEEALPHKEQEWYESLVHLFVIKDSGILLYEHEFIEEDRTAQSDLISGGIIGLITMLNEITKGKEKLRAIDHGDKKLMFKFNHKKSVIFTLLIKEDLFVLRNKLDRFVSDFEDVYEEKLEALPTGNTGGWIVLSELVEKHFQRKYFQILVKEN